jgi:anti-sigma regulatory factor (Ser/Thr protein kinase)
MRFMHGSAPRCTAYPSRRSDYFSPGARVLSTSHERTRSGEAAGSRDRTGNAFRNPCLRRTRAYRRACDFGRHGHQNVRPARVGMIGGAVAERLAEGRATQFIVPADDDSARFVREIQLDRFVEGKVTDESSAVAVRRLLALDPSYTVEVARVVRAGVPGMEDDTAYTIQLCLNELLQNVFEWSDSRIGCIALARWFRRTRSVRLAVVDRGVGIPERLRSRRITDLHQKSDAEVIVAAVTQPKLTSRPAGLAGGLGLKTIHDGRHRTRWAVDGSGIRRQSGVGTFSSGLEEDTAISWNRDRDRFSTGPARDKSRRIHSGVLSDSTPSSRSVRRCPRVASRRQCSAPAH